MNPTRKIALLIGGIIIAFILCYNLAFSKTLHLKGQVAELEQNTVGLQELMQLNQQLSRSERQIDSILNRNNLKNTTVQNGLLNFLNTQKENSSIQIVSFDQPHRIEGENEVTVSYSFELTGQYNDLLDVLFNLEQKVSFGPIKSVKMETKRNYKRRSTLLHCRVIVENIESKS